MSMDRQRCEPHKRDGSGDMSYRRHYTRRCWRIGSWCLTWCATSILCVVPIAAVETNSSPKASIPFDHTMAIDVILTSDGQLVGKVVFADETPGAATRVEIQDLRTNTIQSMEIDAQGRFSFSGVMTGQAIVSCDGQHQSVRVWARDLAPPSAVEQLTIQWSPDRIVRGQRPMSELFCNEPVMIGVLVAAAIAIPIALHNSGNSSDASN